MAYAPAGGVQILDRLGLRALNLCAGATCIHECRTERVKNWPQSASHVLEFCFEFFIENITPKTDFHLICKSKTPGESEEFKCSYNSKTSGVNAEFKCRLLPAYIYCSNSFSLDHNTARKSLCSNSSPAFCLLPVTW